MQPFDALTMRAVLQEAGPLLLNRRVDSVHQFARDEIVIVFRGRHGEMEFRLSAHPVFGRLCLLKTSTNRKRLQPGEIRSGFITLLKKSLFGATLVGIEQQPGERILDLIFSCVDEVGAASLKTLTAEIMGRHSNIVFWERSSQVIIAASHLVNAEMSRLRQIQPGLKYVRPPGQERANIFTVEKEAFDRDWQAAASEEGFQPGGKEAFLERWLTAKYSGLGKNLAYEIALATVKESADTSAQSLAGPLWQCVEKVQKGQDFKPAMKLDLTRYSILDLPGETANPSDWQILPAVNDLIDVFYRTAEARQAFKQTRERMLKESQSEIEKLSNRWQAVSGQEENGSGLGQSKLFGDLIMANLLLIAKGQSELNCQNVFSENAENIVIPLNASLTGVQNAQNYYRQFAKSRNRKRNAELTARDTEARLKEAQAQLSQIERAESIEALRAVKHGLSLPVVAKTQENHGSSKNVTGRKDKKKARLLTLNSSDGWLIYVGRNRQENDYLLGKISQPRDLWLHILGMSGAHVLIKVPSTNIEPPLTTIREAAQLAARFSKLTMGAKVRVIYTQARFVKRASNGKAGVVSYENEKTIEIDTAAPLPKIMKQLFGSGS